MNSEPEVNAINNFVVIDLLFIKPKKSSGLINPHNQSRMIASRNSYIEHRFKGVVIKAPEMVNNNGLEYPNPFKTGDVALLTGLPIEGRETIVHIKGIPYLLIRFAEIWGWYTPTAEEVKEFAYDREQIAPPPMPIEKSVLVADRKIGKAESSSMPVNKLLD